PLAAVAPLPLLPSGPDGVHGAPSPSGTLRSTLRAVGRETTKVPESPVQGYGARPHREPCGAGHARAVALDYGRGPWGGPGEPVAAAPGGARRRARALRLVRRARRPDHPGADHGAGGGRGALPRAARRRAAAGDL